MGKSFAAAVTTADRSIAGDLTWDHNNSPALIPLSLLSDALGLPNIPRVDTLCKKIEHPT